MTYFFDLSSLLLQNALTFVEVIRIIRGTLMRDA
ncbi:Uncharacterised protein [Ewingella americana]|uniref:Uncharacterized protein n=1 Tax=Ewingella americana TaxID=41202 RepID=A0A377NF36_9GAMM|nr:Uncharacterised protein [Ewingella americana]